jgi:hypothetical protein
VACRNLGSATQFGLTAAEARWITVALRCSSSAQADRPQPIVSRRGPKLDAEACHHAAFDTLTAIFWSPLLGGNVQYRNGACQARWVVCGGMWLCTVIESPM